MQKLLNLSLSNLRASNHATVSKIGCPHASEFRPVPGGSPRSGILSEGSLRENSETRLSESDPPASRCEALRAGGGQAHGALHHVMGRGTQEQTLPGILGLRLHV